MAHSNAVTVTGLTVSPCAAVLQADGDEDMQDAVGDKRSEVRLAEMQCIVTCTAAITTTRLYCSAA